jgi:hypothetical protein
VPSLEQLLPDFYNSTPCLGLAQDFFSPAAAGKEALRVVLTPKSKAHTPAASAAQDGGPASAVQSVPRTAGRSRLSQVGLATDRVEPFSRQEGSIARMPLA